MRLIFTGLFMTILFAFSAPIFAGDRVILGYGRLVTNDWFGDNQDRWHTGSVVMSALQGSEGMQARPPEFGTMLEYRIGARAIAPVSLAAPAVGDRAYAGVLSLGVHSHFATAGYEIAAGLDLVATGPQTGLGSFQNAFHNLAGDTGPSAAVLAGQIPNAIYPTALIEVARPMAFGESLTFRPYLEAQAGVENYVRVGGDLTWGAAWGQGVFVRDVTTGQVYQSARITPEPGFSALIGGDMAHVFSSALLPASDGYQLAQSRNRLRMGLHLQGEKASAFYGVTWLGREFGAQPEGQVVGSVRLRIRF